MTDQPLAHAAPTYTNGQEASLVLGRPGFTSNTADASQNKVHDPLRIAVGSVDYLPVADPSNHQIFFFASPNIPPTISSLSDQTVAAGQTAGPFAFTIDDPDNPADLTLSASSSDESIVPAASIAFAGSGSDRSISVTPAGGISGSATITITVSDGLANADTSFALTVRQAPDFGSDVLAAGSYSSTYSQSLAVNSGDTPISYSLAGDLPAGLSFDTDTAILSGTPTATGSFSLTVTADNDVGQDSRNIALLINKATLNVTVDDAGRSYGEDNPPFSGTLSGLVNGDNITASYTTTAVINSPIGTYPIVPQFNDPGGRLANYDIITTSGTLTVTKKTLIITARDETRRIGEPDPAFVALYSGFIDGEDESVLDSTPQLSTTATIDSEEGDYAITVSGAAAANYEISHQAGTLTIVRRYIPTIIWQPADLVYGTSLSSAQLNATAEFNGIALTGRFIYTGTNNAPLDAGSGYVLEVKFMPSDITKYAQVTAQAQIDVTPAPLTVTVDAATKVYGAENPAFTGTISGTVKGDNITAGYSTPADAASIPGDYPIQVSLKDPQQRLANYDVTLADGTLSVTKAPLAVSANDQHIYVGQELPELTCTIQGLVNNDTIADALSGALATTAITASEPGEYAISQGDLAAEHYEIVFSPGTLRITARPQVSITELQAGRQRHPLVRGTAPAGMQVRVTLNPRTRLQTAADAAAFEVTADGDDTWEVDTSSATPVQGSLPKSGYPAGMSLSVMAEIIIDGNVASSSEQLLEMQSMVYLPFIGN